MGGKVWLRVWLSMFEVILPLYVAFVVLCVFVFMSHHTLSSSLQSIATEIKDNGIDLPPSFIEELKDEMYNIVQETIEGMNPPTAADHLMGALGQLVQMKLAKSMNLLDAISPAPPEGEPNE